jgi:hypothetical protein
MDNRYKLGVVLFPTFFSAIPARRRGDGRMPGLQTGTNRGSRRLHQNVSKVDEMRQILLATIILCLVSLACSAIPPMTPGDYIKEFGGDISIYTRILGITDCTELHGEFEQADENVKLQEPDTQEYQASLGYRTAAENRWQELECRGDLRRNEEL